MNKLIIAIATTMAMGIAYADKQQGDVQNGAIHHIGDGGGTVGEYTNDNTNQQQQGQAQGQLQGQAQGQGQASFNDNNNSNSFSPTINVTTADSPVRPLNNNINVTPAANNITVDIPKGAFTNSYAAPNVNVEQPDISVNPGDTVINQAGDTQDIAIEGSQSSSNSTSQGGAGGSSTIGDTTSKSGSLSTSKSGDSNSSNSLTINEAPIPAVTHSTYKYSGGYTVKNTPDASAPSLTSSNGTCMGSTSVGGSAPGIGLSVGSTWVDDGCTRRYDSQMMFNLGYPDVAVNIMCQSESVAKAAPELCKEEHNEAAANKERNVTSYNKSNGFF